MNPQRRFKVYWFFRSIVISSIFLFSAMLLLLGFSTVYVKMQKIGFDQNVSVLSYTDGTVNIYGFMVDLTPLKDLYMSVLNWTSERVTLAILILKEMWKTVTNLFTDSWLHF